MRASLYLQKTSPLPELRALEMLLTKAENRGASIQTLATIPYKNLQFPIYGVTFGSSDPKAPCLGVFGGVHGVERIGSQVALSFLSTLTELLNWDESLHHVLKSTRIAFMPLINPVGTYLGTRANGNSVDLMRNAPLEAEAGTVSKYFLPAGQRISPHLPWFRGTNQFELENQTLIEFVNKNLLQSRHAISVDVHSGYGTQDRLWFPYAFSKKPFPLANQIFQMKRQLDKVHPNHIYTIEPQSLNYCTHGDIWDYLSLQSKNIYIPLCLEIGSWIWVKKSPTQFFSMLGRFNPVKPHRLARALRRHIALFDFLLRYIHNSEKTFTLSPNKSRRLNALTEHSWYKVDP